VGLLAGKVAIVTGAGRGIGRGEALALAGQGDQARDVIARVRALRGSHEPDAAERGYWRWFSHAFALPDPYAQES